MARLINEQRLIRDTLKRDLTKIEDSGVGNTQEHSLFQKRIKDYEDCISFNIEGTRKLAKKYGCSEDFYFLPEKNRFFFNPKENPYPVLELFFLVLSRIKISSINFFGLRFELERR